jgi:hypothetical protein
MLDAFVGVAVTVGCGGADVAEGGADGVSVVLLAVGEDVRGAAVAGSGAF